MDIITTSSMVTTRHFTVLRSENAHGGTLAWDGCDEYPCQALVFTGTLDDDDTPVGCNHTMPEVTS